MGQRIAHKIAFLTRLAIVHLPPRRRGLRLADLSERYAGRPDHLVTATHQTGYKVDCDLSDAIQRSIFYAGTYEPRLSEIIATELCAGDIFLDLGANVGHYSLLAASRLASRGRVLAVEASSETAERLRVTVTRNRLGHMIEVYQVAAADKFGSMILAHPDDSVSFMGMRYLDPGSCSGEWVRVVRLEDFLPVIPSVVKVDVEGADLRAIMGMDRWFEISPPRCFFVEAIESQLSRFGDSVSSLLTFMQDRGYRGTCLAEQWFPDTIVFRR